MTSLTLRLLFGRCLHAECCNSQFFWGGSGFCTDGSKDILHLVHGKTGKKPRNNQIPFIPKIADHLQKDLPVPACLNALTSLIQLLKQRRVAANPSAMLFFSIIGWIVFPLSTDGSCRSLLSWQSRVGLVVAAFPV